MPVRCYSEKLSASAASVSTAFCSSSPSAEMTTVVPIMKLCASTMMMDFAFTGFSRALFTVIFDLKPAAQRVNSDAGRACSRWGF